MLASRNPGKFNLPAVQGVTTRRDLAADVAPHAQDHYSFSVAVKLLADERKPSPPNSLDRRPRTCLSSPEDWHV